MIEKNVYDFSHALVDSEGQASSEPSAANPFTHYPMAEIVAGPGGRA